MASKRMIAGSVMLTDSYLCLSYEAQSLFIALNLNADDDGFVDGAVSTLRITGTTKEHIDELIASGFILRFQSGVLLIRHWHLLNYIKSDRYHETVHLSEKSMVELTNDHIYKMKTETDSIQNGNTMDTAEYQFGDADECRIDEYNSDKDNSKEINSDEFQNNEDNTDTINSDRIDAGRQAYIVSRLSALGIQNPDAGFWNTCHRYGYNAVDAALDKAETSGGGNLHWITKMIAQGTDYMY